MVPAPSHWIPRVPWYSGRRRLPSSSAYGAFTLCGRPFQRRSASFPVGSCGPLPRRASRTGLGSSRFARRYSGNHFCFLFLRLLRCFSSPGSPPCVMDWRMDDRSSSCRVSPFRYLRLSGYLLLPAAFRSLSRLSSALSAKASTLCSYQLNHLSPCIALLAMVCFSCSSICFHMASDVLF